MRRKRFPWLESSLAILLLTGACSDNPMAPTMGEPPRVALDNEAVTADSYQALVRFSARVTDQNGRDLAGVPLEWETDSPQVLEVLGDGTFRTLSNGTATVTARVSRAYPSVARDGYSANMPVAKAVVRVEQKARRLGLFAARDSAGSGHPVASGVDLWAIDDLLALVARPVDNESQIVRGLDPVLTWSSGNERIVTIDAHGRLTPVSDGEATIRVSGGGLDAELVVRVRATQTLRTCARLRTGGGNQTSGTPTCASLGLTFTRGG